MTAFLEATVAYLFKNARGRDEKCFHKGPAFSNFKEPTIAITSPDCGETGATLAKDYTADGTGRIPTLEWTAPDDMRPLVKEWLLVSEDPDAPLPTPICHGIYGGILPEKTSVEPSDFEILDDDQARLKGGFFYGKNRRSNVYTTPRPLLNHGVHRYFFEIVALSEPLDQNMLSAKASKEDIASAIQGKVLGWGLWIGSCERRWS